MSRDVDNLLKFSRENFERFVDAGEYSDQDVIDLWCEVKAAKEEIARINCDYYADKQRFVVQRRELAEAKERADKAELSLKNASYLVAYANGRLSEAERREQKLREAAEKCVNIFWEVTMSDEKSLSRICDILTDVLDSLYPKEETK